ncbi:TVG1327879 [Thermoplasma volcanium GSS1]|uniref:TVG1327879 protein n=1 Tax=Thermoplasma volcanium (strain ATCC 51530 / DSM 4299 / JCM 9571 / NBRC 15438 / GSS1) TaxID=273116 RepID=Q978X7_THEVO|nr:DUF3834 domain-containing protein [Thermoplasma volcanium]BAB60429.1 TVG1327879 [Thermoplasma volcanium GSS1]
MEKIKAIVAPGPVSYPLIAAKAKDIDMIFDKKGQGDIVLDSTVSLVKRGINFNISLIRKLSVVYPDIGKKIGVWRKGSANDVLLRALLDLNKKESEIVYAEDQREIRNMLTQNKIDSAVLSSAFAKGKAFEDLFAETKLYMPGSCAAYVKPEILDYFNSVYSEGIDRFRQDPSGTAEYVASVLPIKFDTEFIHAAILKSESGPLEVKPYEEFRAIVLNHSS